MQASPSAFLSGQKDTFRELVRSLSADFGWASALVTDVAGTRYEVSRRETSVRDGMWTERGAVLRVHDGTAYAELSLDRWPDGADAAALEALNRRVAAALREAGQAVRRAGIGRAAYPPPREEPLQAQWRSEVEVPPGRLSPDQVIARLRSMQERSWPVSPELVEFRVLYEEVSSAKLYLSGARELEQSTVWSQGYLMPFLRRAGRTRYLYATFSGQKGAELLDEMEPAVEEAVREAALLLDAARVRPGEYEVICDPSVSGLIAHEAFGHGVEMDMFVRNRARAAQYLGRPVASGKVTMHDGARAARQVASYLFDDEGTPGSDTVVIDRGVLKAGISDLLSALRLGTVPTGNGRRESFERKAYARMTHTFFAPGEDPLEDMIASIRHGYLLQKYFSGMEDPKNWGIQCLVAYGREIRDGRLTGAIVSPVVMTGYVPDLLAAISMVSPEVRLSGSGMCGKGHKEYVKTAIGGPYIKTRARLG